MPLQSASDKILAAMHRWYRSEHYARRVELIRDQLPNAAIGADVIAGFPGETAADHAATLDFINRRPFTYLHVFSYSVRPGTAAEFMPDHVPVATIKQRARELRALSEKKSADFRESQLATTLEILTLRHTPTEHSSPPPPINSLVDSRHLHQLSATPPRRHLTRLTNSSAQKSRVTKTAILHAAARNLRQFCRSPRRSRL